MRKKPITAILNNPLNRAALDAVKAGHTTAKEIATVPKCKAQINAIAKADARNPARVLQGALQALRVQGIIEYKRGAWLYKGSLDL